MTDIIADNHGLNRQQALRRPPEPQGRAGLQALWTVIGQRDVLGAMQQLHADLGDVFRLAVPNFSPIVLVGPEAARFVLLEARDDLRWRSESDAVTRLLGQGLLVADGDWHDTMRRHMNPALHRRMLAGYTEAMIHAADRVSRTWQPGQTVDMLVELRRIALLILVQTMFRVDLGPDMSRLWPAVMKALQYISPGPWILWPGMPRPSYRRALADLDRYLFDMIRMRRANPGPDDDLLGILVRLPELSDRLIRDQLLTMLVAGHDTSTAALAWSLYLLGRHPAVMARARAEVDTVLGDQPPTVDRVTALPYLEQVIRESLRLYPPAHVGMRRPLVDLAFQGFRLPAGSRVIYSIYLTHRHPDHWPDPDRFDPDRFSPEQSRDRDPFAYIPFGGGPRICIGYAFAQVELKVVLARLLQQFEFALLPKPVHPHMGVTLEPRPGVMMTVQPRCGG